MSERTEFDWYEALIRLVWLGVFSRSQYLREADNDDAEPMMAHDIILRREEAANMNMKARGLPKWPQCLVPQ